MNYMKRMVTLALTLLMITFGTAAYASSFQEDLAGIDQAAKSVLMLEVFDTKDQLLQYGSGFVVFDSYTLVTNYSVIKGADWIRATSDVGNYYMVTKVIAADEKKDIALLEFFSPTNLQPLVLNTDGGLKRAAPVVAIGSPRGVTNTVSLGNISALYDQEGVPIIQFTAPISEGSSGGALFDDMGFVIGMTTRSFSEGQNMNLAVDIGAVITLKDSSFANKRQNLSDFFGRDGGGAIPFPVSGSAAAEVTPAPAPEVALHSPGNVHAVRVEGGVKLTWDTVADAQQYVILRSESKYTGYTQIGTTISGEFIDDKAVQPVYFYQVASQRGEEISQAPATLAVIPALPQTAELAVPKSVKAKVSKTSASLSWSKVKNAKWYLVYRSTEKDTGFEVIAAAYQAKYVDESATLGMTYYYKVQAVQPELASSLSAAAAAKMPKPTPTPRPTATPYLEPEFFVQGGKTAQWNKKEGYWRVNPKIVNTSKTSTVDGFTLVYFCEDIAENLIEQNGTGVVYLEVKVDKKINPQKSVWPGYTHLVGFDNVKYINIAVTQIHTTDGRTIDIPMNDWNVGYIELK